MSKKKLAVVVPYRAREGHWQKFLPAIRKHLAGEGIEFDIFRVEQGGSLAFNKGRVCNVGFLLAEGCSWICFHDVDLVPLEGCDYSPPESPTQLWTETSKSKHEPNDPINLGAVALFLPEHFRRVNGFGNNYWGWGFEDNDLTNRCRAKGLVLARRPGIYRHLPEDVMTGPDENYDANLEQFHAADYDSDGLNSLEYEVLQVREAEGHIEVLVDVGSREPGAPRSRTSSDAWTTPVVRWGS